MLTLSKRAHIILKIGKGDKYMHRYNKLLSSAVPLRADELSCVLEYLYQSIIFANTQKEFSELCERLALDEMRHYKMLSEFIFEIDGDISVNMHLRTPSICCAKNETDAYATLCANIRAKKEAAAEYLKLASTTGDPHAARLFHTLSDDESMHVRLLSELAERMTE